MFPSQGACKEAYYAAQGQPGGSDGWIDANLPSAPKTERKNVRQVTSGSGTFPPNNAAKYYDSDLNKLPRPASCTPELCTQKARCLWCQLPDKWEAFGSNIFKPKHVVSTNALQCSVSKSADVPAIDASTALAEGKQQDYNDAQNRNLWMAVLANSFGVGRDDVALQPIEVLLQEPLIAHASKKFSVECKRYHDALFEYSSLPKKRARQPAQITLDTEAEILTIEREMRVWFSRAKKIDLQSGSLAAKSIALVHLQEASTGIASCMVSLTHKMKPMSRNKEGLLRAAKKRADPVSRLKITP